MPKEAEENWYGEIKYILISGALVELDDDQHHQVSNIRRTLVGYKIVDHSDVVGASPVGAAPTTSSFSTGFIGLGKDNCQTRQETIKFGDLVRLILDILWYTF